MNIVFTSNCTKKSISKTAMVLDSYLVRVGNLRTWNGSITRQGLDQIIKELRQTATKNTSVSCFSAGNKSRLSLLCTIGSKRDFNEDGEIVLGRKKVWRAQQAPFVHRPSVEAIMTEAAMCHDIGKCSSAFQNILRPQSQDKKDQSLNQYTVRHELLSYWAWRLMKIDGMSWKDCWRSISEKVERPDHSMGFDPGVGLHSPLQMAMAIGLTHHKLLSGEIQPNRVLLNDEGHNKSALHQKDSKQDIRLHNEDFNPHNNARAARVLSRNHAELAKINNGLGEATPAIFYHSRLGMQLADHSYSRDGVVNKKSSDHSDVYANTKDGRLNQPLDDHLLGVEGRTKLALRAMEDLRFSMPGLQSQDIAQPISNTGRFAWQGAAVELVQKAKEANPDAAAFTAIAADVGCGKTQAALRIAIAAYSGTQARITSANFMRKLAHQNHAEFSEKLGIRPSALGVYVGGSEITEKDGKAAFGIDSDEDAVVMAIDEQPEVPSSVLKINGGSATQKAKDHINFISVPLLVCTTDFIWSAFQPHSGRHLVASQRIISSDIILDEADAYDLDALIVMANHVGMCGRNFHIVSATMTAKSIAKIHSKWLEGYASYCAMRGVMVKTNALLLSDEAQHLFMNQKDIEADVKKAWIERANAMAKRPALRKARVIRCTSPSAPQGKNQYMRSIANEIAAFHKDNHTKHAGKTVSTGIIRLDKIKDVVKLTKYLARHKSEVGVPFRVIVHHGNFSNIERATKELLLSKLLNRHGNEEKIFENVYVKEHMQNTEDLAIVIVTTSLSERGNDWDVDWCIMEPGNLNNMPQLGGRVNRHRRKPVERCNIGIMDHPLNQGKSFKTHTHEAIMDTQYGCFSDCIDQKWLDNFNISPLLGHEGLGGMRLSKVGLKKIEDCSRQEMKFKSSQENGDLGRICVDFYPALRKGVENEITFSVLEDGTIVKESGKAQCEFFVEDDLEIKELAFDTRSRKDIYHEAMEMHGLNREQMRIGRQIGLKLYSGNPKHSYFVSESLGVYAQE